jgi:hypothetical protein
VYLSRSSISFQNYLWKGERMKNGKNENFCRIYPEGVTENKSYDQQAIFRQHADMSIYIEMQSK